jgi:hypothetical protein
VTLIREMAKKDNYICGTFIKKKGPGINKFGTVIIFGGTHVKIYSSVPKKKECDSSKKDYCMLIMANTF